MNTLKCAKHHLQHMTESVKSLLCVQDGHCRCVIVPWQEMRDSGQL